MLTCRLCSDSTEAETREVWNQPLLESDNFVVLPSLGALVEGWLLIVPRNHVISIGALSFQLDAELHALKMRVARNLEVQYGPAAAFEHGPSRKGRAVGCGVDHAHLHLVPIEFDLTVAAAPFMPSSARWIPGSADSCREAYAAGVDYLYVEQPIGTAHIAVSDRFASQVIRKGIASQLHIADQYNWRDHPHLANVESTVARFFELSQVE